MLRLQEKPSEWIKFTAVMGIACNMVVALLWWRGGLSFSSLMMTAFVALVVVLTSMARPFWFRAFYRGGMTVSFSFGQAIGRILLFLLFAILVIPLGLILRLCRKDLLQLKPLPQGETYWRTARNNRNFERMF
jgi:hypothetical protein